MAKSFINILFVVTFIFLLNSCSSNNIIPINHDNDPLTKKTYLNILNNQYPDSFALTQRIILNVSGKQYDFIGQLTMNRGKAYRAVAFGEMGGQFIDLLAAGNSDSILANPTNLPVKPILQGVAEDIKQLFNYKKISDLKFSDLTGSLIKITINPSYDDQLIYLINSNNNEILNLNFYSGKKQIRSAEFLEYKKFVGWDREFPSFIKLTNHRWHFTLEIRLLKFNMQYDADKIFNVK